MNPKDSDVYSGWIWQGLSDPEGGRMNTSIKMANQKNIRILRICAAVDGSVFYKHLTSPALIAISHLSNVNR